MREIDVKEITGHIKEMCIEANHILGEDMKSAMEQAVLNECAPLGKQILEQLKDNLRIAGEDMIPICQDTGMAVVFMEIGQDVHFVGSGKGSGFQRKYERQYPGGDSLRYEAGR